jgi:hypothetical protein
MMQLSIVNGSSKQQNNAGSQSKRGSGDHAPGMPGETSSPKLKTFLSRFAKSWLAGKNFYPGSNWANHGTNQAGNT